MLQKKTCSPIGHQWGGWIAAKEEECRYDRNCIKCGKEETTYIHLWEIIDEPTNKLHADSDCPFCGGMGMVGSQETCSCNTPFKEARCRECHIRSSS